MKCRSLFSGKKKKKKKRKLSPICHHEVTQRVVKVYMLSCTIKRIQHVKTLQIQIHVNTRQSAQWGTYMYTPEERYRQFLTSTKYVALTLEMVGWMNSMLIAISPKPLCRRIIKFNKRS